MSKETDISLFIETIREMGEEGAVLKLSRQFAREDIAYIMDQVNGRKTAVEKFPFLTGRTDIIYPPAYYLEQTSSEKTASFKSSLVSGNSLVDMTGGFGIDSYFFSKKIPQVWYVEQDEIIYKIGASNLKTLAPDIIALHSDSIRFLRGFDGHVDWIYLDPIRRNRDKRLKSTEEYSPNIHEIRKLLLQKASQIMVKLSPMTDIKQAVSIFGDSTSRIIIIAVDNECRELLIIAGAGQHTPRLESVHMHDGVIDTFASGIEHNEKPGLSEPLRYLYEPNAAVYKAGQYDAVALKFSLTKLHPNTHVFTASELHPDYPGRVYEVTNVLPFDAREFSTAAAGKTYNIKCRNFPMDPAGVAKKLRIKEGGENFLFCVRTIGDKVRLIDSVRIM